MFSALKQHLGLGTGVNSYFSLTANQLTVLLLSAIAWLVLFFSHNKSVNNTTTFSHRLACLIFLSQQISKPYFQPSSGQAN
jgi:hypothetical protein